MGIFSEILFVIVAIVATVAVGLVISWLVRKVGAMVHYRIGPPVLQPVWDVMKLMGKETLRLSVHSKLFFQRQFPTRELMVSVMLSHSNR